MPGDATLQSRKSKFENRAKKPIFFASATEFRKWLRHHHAVETELWVGYYRKHTERPSMTWQESVDEALCFGWIDGIRKRVDHDRYMNRFTPRRRGSIWSATNIRRVETLTNEKRMQPAGLAAFARRIENKSGIYSYEQRREKLPRAYATELRKNPPAWKYFLAQSPSYRKMVVWWIVSAKQEPTRRKRLEKLIAASACGQRL